MIETPLCTDCRDVFDPRHLQVTKGVGIEQIYPSVGASIKASGLWILNLLRTSYSRDLLMFILASFVSSSVGEIVMQGCDLQLMRWIHTTSFLLFPHQECVHILYIYIYMCIFNRIPLQHMYTDPFFNFHYIIHCYTNLVSLKPRIISCCQEPERPLELKLQTLLGRRCKFVEGKVLVVWSILRQSHLMTRWPKILHPSSYFHDLKNYASPPDPWKSWNSILRMWGRVLGGTIHT